MKSLIQNQFWQRKSLIFFTCLESEISNEMWLQSSVDNIRWYNRKCWSCRKQSKYLIIFFFFLKKCNFNEIEIFQRNTCKKWYTVHPINIHGKYKRRKGDWSVKSMSEKLLKLVFLVNVKGIRYQYSEIIRLHTYWLSNSMFLAYTKPAVQ